ncbi:hypothetical protein OM076_18385 [Solirubrobacter ginsenosidimutans]|uniref:Uncharacterized protein n=1 Tax=Solirubrobacter ginsenosidimutans TaxID=490573 RepID=A0A9X3MVX2_9ACTN|nr:hypothetical protein [Solirubrobacter ginsenosidimutans]MDA0162247.1 hypothetical protein [Solirubrobacter ginsenosidimutans]
MTALRPDFPQILTLSEQLDAMLLGWLERNAQSVPAEAQAGAILTVVAEHLPEVETFCARWDMRVERLGGGTKWQSIRVDGPRLPVLGFAQITSLYRA